MRPLGRVRAALSGWRLPLRLARRDALQARARSLLVIAMIALPVLAVTAALVAQRTSDVSTAEGLDRTLGAAEARVVVEASRPTPVLQDADGSFWVPVDGAEQVTALTAETISAALGGAEVVAFDDSQAQVETDAGVTSAIVYQGDLADPLTAGLVDLASGRLPRAVDEVVVNQALLDEGYAVGDPLRLVDTGTSGKDGADGEAGAAGATGATGATGPTIVGVAESTTVRTLAFAAGPAGSLPVAEQQTARSYLVGDEPVSWAAVRQLNDLGGVVVSREVVLDPPPESEIPPQVRSTSAGSDPATITAAVLVVTMALLEVVLLAGPAFAVGARRLQRSLALMAAAGGTPAQARRVVLAGALVIGLAAAVVGVLLGVVVGAVLVPLLQLVSDSYLGPFEVPILPILAVAGFGVLSAVLAAVVPASIASRQDVVAVLAGRRGDAAASSRSPVVGLVLLGVGVAAAVAGSQQQSSELLIAGAALLCVLGMILLVPVVLVLVSRLAGRLPLSLRYAARDAARHRTRTVPAVAAVAATVAGVVALLIANTSDAAENEATYLPAFADGVGAISAYSGIDDLGALQAAVTREAPRARQTTVRGVPESFDAAAATYSYTELVVPEQERPLMASYGSGFGSTFLVSDGELPPGLLGVSAEDRAAARTSLASGGVVAFTDDDARVAPSQAQLMLRTVVSDNQTGEVIEDRADPLDTTVLHVATTGASPAAVLSPAAAQAAGLEVADVGLVLDGATISEDQEEALSQALTATDTGLFLSVERGYEAEDETLILQLVLLGLGAVLMLGGTLTATFLALADARPDLSTLAAVGASPRRRRSVAAAYALVVGSVGALLGAAVGFVPGLAVAVPLTSTPGDVAYSSGTGNVYVSASGAGSGPFIDVPWLMLLALVIALPLLTAGLVALTARSRLPLVARPD